MASDFDSFIRRVVENILKYVSNDLTKKADEKTSYIEDFLFSMCR